ncbi:MAG: FecR family protein [Bacteroides sp.]|nr:FecR family protein [Bacteroides sp.]
MRSTTDTYKILLDKYLQGYATDEEVKTLARWMMETEPPEEFDAYCQQHWDTSSVEINKQLEQQMWEVIATRIEQPRKSLRLHPVFYRIAICILLPICICMGGYIGWLSYSDHRQRPEVFEVLADNGQKACVILPDGSKAWINSATRLKYDFVANERRVDLEGEAYFEVVKNKKKFVVCCQGMNVEALGTAFNVKGYTADNQVSVALMEGSVKIYNELNSALLSPNQCLTYIKNENTFVRSEIKDEREIDFWRRNILYFRSATLADIATTLERMYGVTIQFEDEALKQIPFSGSIRNASLNNVFHIFSLSYPIHYTIDNDVITIVSAQTP